MDTNLSQLLNIYRITRIFGGHFNETSFVRKVGLVIKFSSVCLCMYVLVTMSRLYHSKDIMNPPLLIHSTAKFY